MTLLPYSNCKGCVFAEGVPKQLSCRLNRSTKLGIQDTDEDGFFVLSRLCNTYRPEDWLKDLSLAESENINETVRTEIYPPVGFFIMLRTEDESGVSKLKSTLEDIKAQKLYNARYVVVITDKVEYNEEAFALLDSMFDYKETKFHIVQLEIIPQNKHWQIDEAFKHAQNGWAYVTSAGEDIPRDLLFKIDKWLNTDMKRLVVIKPYDDINGLVFQAALFKFLNGNKTKLYSDEVEDSRSFLEKVNHASIESDDHTFITWSEFNES